VKKRRAERERAKSVAEEKDQEHGDADLEQSPQIIPEEEEEQTPRLPKEDNIIHPPIDTPTMAPAEQPHEEPGRITTAVNLPPQRLHRREASFTHRVQIPQVESPTKDKPSLGGDVFNMDLSSERPEVKPGTPEPSTGSTSEDEDDESSSTDDDEDESDVYSEDNAHSKTTLGAGVEKVSRHKDVPQSKTPTLPHSTLKNQLPTTTIEA